MALFVSQACLLHASASTAHPEHGWAPIAGGGESHRLCLQRAPPPQGAEHALHEPHSDHPASLIGCTGANFFVK